MSTDEKIDQLINDPNYEIRSDGTIWTIVPWNKMPAGVWRQTGLTQKFSRPTCKYWTIWYKGSQLRVPRVIYRKFVGELQPGMQVDHIDGDSLNDHPSNLQQITNQQNSQRGRMTKLTQDQVDQIRLRRADGETNASIAKDFNITERHVSGIARGENW